MHPEAAFLAGYAIALVAVAAGLEALGRRSTDPWASRMLAGSRPPDVERADERASWPHSDIPAFHVGLSGAVLAAALLLTAVSIIRHHRPLELAIQLAVLAVISIRVLLVYRHHSGRPAQPDRPSKPGDDRNGPPVRARGR